MAKYTFDFKFTCTEITIFWSVQLRAVRIRIARWEAVQRNREWAMVTLTHLFLWVL